MQSAMEAGRGYRGCRRYRRQPNQERGAEVHFVGEAEQQIPRHREHAEIIGDGQQPQHIARDIERQGCGEEDDDQADQDWRGERRRNITCACPTSRAGAHTSPQPEAGGPELRDRPAK